MNIRLDLQLIIYVGLLTLFGLVFFEKIDQAYFSLFDTISTIQTWLIGFNLLVYTCLIFLFHRFEENVEELYLENKDALIDGLRFLNRFLLGEKSRKVEIFLILLLSCIYVYLSWWQTLSIFTLYALSSLYILQLAKNIIITALATEQHYEGNNNESKNVS